MEDMVQNANSYQSLKVEQRTETNVNSSNSNIDATESSRRFIEKYKNSFDYGENQYCLNPEQTLKPTFKSFAIESSSNKLHRQDNME